MAPMLDHAQKLMPGLFLRTPPLPIPVVLFDLDGTLADFHGKLSADLALIASPNDPTFPVVRGQPRPTWFDRRCALITRQPGWYRSLPRYQPGFELYAMAREIGFTTEILTKGPYKNRSAWTQKAEWCDEQVPGDAVHVVSQKHMHGAILVDDWVPYGELWLQHHPDGLLVLPAHPWNAGFDHPRAIRYDGINDVEVRERMELAWKMT